MPSIATFQDLVAAVLENLHRRTNVLAHTSICPLVGTTNPKLPGVFSDLKATYLLCELCIQCTK